MMYNPPIGTLIVAAFVLCAVGCQADHRLGGLEGFESCGNGIDDDADGQIDEGCPCRPGERQRCFSGVYPNRSTGQCADGEQSCETPPGDEFGAWGACLNDTLPLAEACDGEVDDDCDGAIDEGCPCDAPDARSCAIGFDIFPCFPGRQSCRREGIWSACEGAVGPGPELCSDELDNDCDGNVNEGCACLPSPEVCGDGVDNDCDGIVDEASCSGGSAESWGDFAAELPLGDCPDGQLLLVNTLGVELDGGEALDDPADAGPVLSFVEALFIARNTPSPVTVNFDPAIFPSRSPGTIVMPRERSLPAGIENACIDARGRGVIVDWPNLDPDGGRFVPGFSDGSRVYGLQWRHLPWEMSITGTAQLAGCRFNTDGQRVFSSPTRPWLVLPRFGATVGPGNAFFGDTAIRVLDQSTPTVIGNDFGHDPLTGFSQPMREAVDLAGPLEFHDNVVVASTVFDHSVGHRLSLRGNRFGLDRAGRQLLGAAGVVLRSGAVVGPDNHFSGLPIAIEVLESPVTLTQNRIWSVGEAIRFFSAPHPPPTLISATTEQVEGRCAVPGRVEVFSDLASGAETFEGSTRCDAVTPWRYEGALTLGRGITATLTDDAGATSGLALSLLVSE